MVTAVSLSSLTTRCIVHRLAGVGKEETELEAGKEEVLGVKKAQSFVLVTKTTPLTSSRLINGKREEGEE